MKASIIVGVLCTMFATAAQNVQWKEATGETVDGLTKTYTFQGCTVSLSDGKKQLTANYIDKKGSADLIMLYIASNGEEEALEQHSPKSSGLFVLRCGKALLALPPEVLEKFDNEKVKKVMLYK